MPYPPGPRRRPRSALAAAVAVSTLATLTACGGGPDVTPAVAPVSVAAVRPSTTAPKTAAKPSVGLARKLAPGSPSTAARPVAPPSRGTGEQALAAVLAGGEAPMPADAATAASQLALAEAVVRDPAAAPDRVDAAAWVAQIAYRALGRNREWDGAVLAAVPAALRPVVKRNVAARRAFAELAPDPLPSTLPAWRIVRPLPAATLLGLYAKAERRFDVPWEVLAAVNLVESGIGRIVGLSSAGAKGPMQFMPATWRAYGMGGDVWDPEDAIMGAANYLAAMGARTQSTQAGTKRGLRKALYRYNNHPAYVRGVMHYASVLTGEPVTYRAFHAWRIYYRTRLGEARLPLGYESRKPVPASRVFRPR